MSRTGGKTDVNVGGRPAVVDPQAAAKMFGEGMTHREIGEYFGVSQQAVSKALSKLRHEITDGSKPLPRWPWKMRSYHTEGTNGLYRLMQAYRKHAAGLEVSDRDLRDANALRRASEKLGMAVTYTPAEGFMWTTRRDGEEEEMFVVRD
jgi:hypothetical protein